MERHAFPGRWGFPRFLQVVDHVTVRFGEFTLDPGARRLIRQDGEEIHLSPKAFDLLQLLIESRPRVLDKAALHARIWPHTFVVDADLTVRIALCVGWILPLGILLGFGFPTGMRLISAIDPKPTPWFWGINGAAGVLASIVAVVLSIALGIGATLIAGAFCYFALIVPALALQQGVPAAASVRIMRSRAPLERKAKAPARRSR